MGHYHASFDNTEDFQTTEKPQVAAVTSGALGLSAIALAFGVCCVAPWAVAILGVGGAVLV